MLAVPYMSPNSAREPLAPIVFALATLLPITSRFLLDAFSPDRPCWKLMGCPSCRKWSSACSVDRAHGAVGDGTRAVQLEHQRIARRADRIDLVPHQRGAGQRRATAGGSDAEREVAGVIVGAGSPVEAV